MNQSTVPFTREEKNIIIEVATNPDNGDLIFPKFLLLLEHAPPIRDAGYSSLSEFRELLEQATHS